MMKNIMGSVPKQQDYVMSRLHCEGLKHGERYSSQTLRMDMVSMGKAGTV